MRFFLVLALVLALTGTARAQGNYRSTPIGGRSALLGGTGVALGRDGAAPFMNPATIVRIADQKLAFSVNFYALDFTFMSRWYQPAPMDQSRFGNLSLGDTSNNFQSFNALPSTLCVFLALGNFGEEEANTDARAGPTVPARAGRQKLAACLANIEHDDFSFTGTPFRGASNGIITHQTQSVLRNWDRFAIGPTYAIDVSSKLSFGLSLHGVASTYRNIWSVSSLTFDARDTIGSAFNRGTRGLSIDVAAVLGATFKSGSDTIGLAVHTPALHFLGSASSTYHSQFSRRGATQQVTEPTSNLGAGRGDFAAPPPPRVSLAVGREIDRGLVELSASYTFPQSEGIRSRLIGLNVTEANGATTERPVDETIVERFEPVFNAAFGFEWYVNPQFSVLSGFSTDFSAQPPLAATAGSGLGPFSQSRTTRLTWSGGFGTHGPGGELLVGTKLSYGWGQMYAVDSYRLPPTFALIEHSGFGILLVVAGTTNLRTLKKVVENVGDIVTPDKK